MRPPAMPTLPQIFRVRQVFETPRKRMIPDRLLEAKTLEEYRAMK